MKKTAVLIYNQFCNFEIAPVLEMLAMAQKPITVFAKTLSPVRSEEGVTVLPEKTIDELKLDEYDSLILPGAMDIREAIEDNAILNFIKRFDGMPIGAISIAPLLLLKAGLLNNKPFMAGVNPEDLFEEGYTKHDLALMIGWDASLENPLPGGYIRSDNIITSVSYNFIHWTLAFGKMIGIELPPKVFGIGSKNQRLSVYDRCRTRTKAMKKLEIHFGEVDTAISVMREVAAWGREQGYRVWPDEWLTKEELITSDAQPENFCIGSIDGEIVCAFILQWADSNYWPNAPKYESAYLHKFCVRRKFAGMSMTKLVTEAIRAECRNRGIRYIRLDTGLDEKVVRKIYLSIGYKIVDILDYPNDLSMALYELEVD